MKRKIPEFGTDAEFEAFLDQDLSDLDFTQFKPLDLTFENDVTQLTMRVPRLLLDAVKNRAEERGISYSRYIRELMERDLAHG